MNRKKRKIIVVILAIVASISVLALFSFAITYQIRTPKPRTVRMICINLSSAIDLFVLDFGRLPTNQEGLEILADPPDGKSYYFNRIPVDIWGKEFRYKVTSNNTYVISSAGKDLSFDTDDDIQCNKW